MSEIGAAVNPVGELGEDLQKLRQQVLEARALAQAEAKAARARVKRKKRAKLQKASRRRNRK